MPMTETTKDVKPTITTIFIVPTLKIPRDDLVENNFINGYIRDEMNPIIYENCVFLLFKPSNLDKFNEFVNREALRSKLILEDYDYANGFVVCVYELPTKYKDDYSLVRLGKYSKTSPEFQNEFPKVKKIIINGLHRDELSLQYRVFRRTEDLVKFWEDKLDVNLTEENEVWQKFDENKEILTEEKLKEYE